MKRILALATVISASAPARARLHIEEALKELSAVKRQAAKETRREDESRLSGRRA